MRARSLLLSALSLLTLTGLADAGTKYRITITGEVEFNLASSGTVGEVPVGGATTLSFRVDSGNFVNSASFPTRGYFIELPSWSFDAGGVALPLKSPFTGPDPKFVIRDNDPAVDGFLVSTNVDVPAGVPLAAVGGFGNFENSFYVTYGGSLLPSLDIADAVGSYDFTGLTVFNWTVDDGPVNVVGVLFETLTIEQIVTGSATVYGCGVNPVGSMTIAGADPNLGGFLDLGVDNPLGTQAVGSIPALFVAAFPAPQFPCGFSVNGYGMASQAAPGEVLVDVGGPAFVLVRGLWTGAGNPEIFSIGLPNDATLVGANLFIQGSMIDLSPDPGYWVGLTDAVHLVIGND